MVDIGVYVRKEVLEHKKRDGKKADDQFCYWEFPKPNNVSVGDKFWFASEGEWQGYFLVKKVHVVPGEGIDVDFHSDSWIDCKAGLRASFQGMTYKVPSIIERY